jgi:hypothetical protein
MDEFHSATGSTRVGIECLTLWMESDRHFAIDHVRRLMDDPEGPGAYGPIVGLLNLSMLLAVELAKAQGAEDVKEWAREYLRNLSAQLPD